MLPYRVGRFLPEALGGFHEEGIGNGRTAQTLVEGVSLALDFFQTLQLGIHT